MLYLLLQDGLPIFRTKREPRTAGLAPRTRTTKRALPLNNVTQIDANYALMWTTGRLQCRNGTGTCVQLTAAAFAAVQCKWAAAAARLLLLGSYLE